MAHHPNYTPELAQALHTITTASHLTKSVLHSLQNNVSAETKADSSPVTIADFAAQALIISALKAVYSSDAFLGEENADQLRGNEELAERVWELLGRARDVYEKEHDVENAGRAGLGEVQQGRLGHVRNAANGDTTEEESGTRHTKLVFPQSKDEMLDLIDLGTSTQTSKGRVWVMDPVDGTATFMTGNQYAVCLCLLVDGVQQVAVIGCPNLPLPSLDETTTPLRLHEDAVDADGFGVVLSAVRGQGTYVRRILASGLGLGEPRRIQHDTERASFSTKPNSSSINFVETAWGKTNLSQTEHKAVAILVGGAETSWPGTILWSQQMKYVALTLGATDAMLRLPLDRQRYTAVWDHAGGQLLFQEVGGVVRDIDGGEIDFGQGRILRGERNFGMIAALPGVFENVQRAVGEVLGRRR
jgi:3'(2'), 5'-bisphosphate nucleotidase